MIYIAWPTDQKQEIVDAPLCKVLEFIDYVIVRASKMAGREDDVWRRLLD